MAGRADGLERLVGQRKLLVAERLRRRTTAGGDFQDEAVNFRPNVFEAAPAATFKGARHYFAAEKSSDRLSAFSLVMVIGKLVSFTFIAMISSAGVGD